MVHTRKNKIKRSVWISIPKSKVPKTISYQGIKGHSYWRSLSIYYDKKRDKYYALTESGKWLILKDVKKSK